MTKETFPDEEIDKRSADTLRRLLATPPAPKKRTAVLERDKRAGSKPPSPKQNDDGGA